MPALLTLTTPDGTALEIRVMHSLGIGRGAGNALRVSDKNVSRYHALLARLADGDYELRDGGSSYGTFVNREAVKQRRLKDGDLIQIGDLSLRFALVPQLPGDDSAATTVVEEMRESRARIAALEEQVADLRRTASDASYEEEQASRERDGALADLRSARAELEALRAAHGALEAERARLVEEGRRPPAPAQVAAPVVAPAGDGAALARRLEDKSREVEALKEQVEQLGVIAAQAVEPRKEAARLGQELERTRARLEATTEALQSAMTRVAALTDEVNRLRAR